MPWRLRDGCVIALLGPCLPARPVPKKPDTSSGPISNGIIKPKPKVVPENDLVPMDQRPKLVLKPLSGSWVDSKKEQLSSSFVNCLDAQKLWFD